MVKRTLSAVVDIPQTSMKKARRRPFTLTPSIRVRSNFFGSRVRVTQKYADNVSISGAAGVVAGYTWRLNSTFDPDLTGGGHQPLGRDQYATLFNKYAVLGCKWRVVAAPVINVNFTLTAAVTNNPTIPTNPIAMLELQGTKGPINFTSTAAQYSHYPFELKGTVNLVKLSGCRGIENYLGLDAYSSVVAGNPADSQNLTVAGVNSIAGVSWSALLYIMLEYDVVYFDPNTEIAQS